MQFQILEGKSVGDRWGWQTYTTPDGKGSMELELYQLDAVDHLEMLSRFGLGSGRPDWPGLVSFIAANWWRGLKGAQDVNGTPLPATKEVRELILRQSDSVLTFVLSKLREAAQRRAEGNADSGSV